MRDKQKNVRMLTLKCQLYMVSKINSCKWSSCVARKFRAEVVIQNEYFSGRYGNEWNSQPQIVLGRSEIYIHFPNLSVHSKKSKSWWKSHVWSFRTNCRWLKRFYQANLMAESCPPRTILDAQPLKVVASRTRAPMASHALMHICIPSLSTPIQRLSYQVLLRPPYKM